MDDDTVVEGSGLLFVVLALLVQIETDALARGEPSVMERLRKVVAGQSRGNVIDFLLAAEGPGPRRWRAEASALIDLAAAGARGSHPQPPPENDPGSRGPSE